MPAAFLKSRAPHPRTGEHVRTVHPGKVIPPAEAKDPPTGIKEKSLRLAETCRKDSILFWSGKPETDPAVSFRYVSECYGDLSVFSSPFAPRCISMCQYEDRQSFRQNKSLFYLFWRSILSYSSKSIRSNDSTRSPASRRAAMISNSCRNCRNRLIASTPDGVSRPPAHISCLTA